MTPGSVAPQTTANSTQAASGRSSCLSFNSRMCLSLGGAGRRQDKVKETEPLGHFTSGHEAGVRSKEGQVQAIQHEHLRSETFVEEALKHISICNIHTE